MSDEVPRIYADMITNVSHSNGVFRITFAQQDQDDGNKPVVTMLLPGSQITNILGGINQAVGEIAEQIKKGASAPAARKPTAKRMAKPQKPKGNAKPKMASKTKKKK